MARGSHMGIVPSLAIEESEARLLNSASGQPRRGREDGLFSKVRGSSVYDINNRVMKYLQNDDGAFFSFMLW